MSILEDLYFSPETMFEEVTKSDGSKEIRRLLMRSSTDVEIATFAQRNLRQVDVDDYL